MKDLILSQTNLAEMKRIYQYLSYNTKGCSAWLNKLKELFPEAAYTANSGSIKWNFNPDKIWEIILQNEDWKKILKNRGILGYWELSARTIPSSYFSFKVIISKIYQLQKTPDFRVSFLVENDLNY